MSNKQKETLNEKKRELQSQLEAIQDELDDSVEKVKSEVSSSLNPLGYVRDHPLPAVGVAVLVGFLYASDDEEEQGTAAGEQSGSSTEKLTSTMWYEVKRLAARKALAAVGKYLEAIF